MTFKVNKTPLIFKTIPFKTQQIKPIAPIIPIKSNHTVENCPALEADAKIIEPVEFIGEALGNPEETLSPIQPEIVAQIPEEDDALNILDKPFVFVTGPAGSGKTYTINKYNVKNPDYIELVATTGIAAINLNSKTVNSLLRYFDTDSLLDNYIDQKLHWKLREIREEKKVLGIEEVSMMDARQLDIIFDAINEINEDKNPKKLGLHIIGDLLQLPPVKANMVTEAKCWPYFQENTIRLNKIWRQGNEKFIEAINLVRGGDGRNAVPLLKECGVTFINNLIDKFDGTTLIPKNDLVDQYNDKRLMEVDSEIITSIPRRKGEQLGEWKTQIPNLMRFKVGAYVMILSNDCPAFTYVNGDCGEIIAYNKTTDVFVIRLKRNNNEVQIKRRKLLNLTKKQPNMAHFGKDFTPYVDTFTHKWIIGEVEYHPLRLAYATTIHKSQGLSLDKLQININTWNFGLSGMAYVAISRARTPEGLFIVGTEDALIAKIKTERSVLEYV